MKGNRLEMLTTVNGQWFGIAFSMDNAGDGGLWVVMAGWHTCGAADVHSWYFRRWRR